MNRHLVTVEVGIESPAGQRVKHNSIAFHKYRLKRLNTHPMKSRGTVEQYRMLMNHFFKNIPYLFIMSFNHSFGAFYRIRKAVLFKLPDNEWLIQFQCYFFRQPALM